jgi:hypothetical protein
MLQDSSMPFRTLRSRVRLVAGLLTALLPCRLEAAVELPIAEGTIVRFADVPEGVAALSVRDDYIQQLSPFDLQVRTRTPRPVSEQEFVAFLGKHVIPWTDHDVEILRPLVADIARKLLPWKLPLPSVILLVKTTGGEEGAAAYCRGPAIILPRNMVEGSPTRLANIFPHELFHVLSNQNPDLRKALYATIGFQPCNEVALPPALAALKITNPDAPRNNHYITVTQNGQPTELMPILVAKMPFNPASRGNLFSYLDFRLLELENKGGERQPRLVNGQAVLLDPASVPGYHEQIGGNTKYIIHPEEVLADNFVYLLNGRQDLASPQVVSRMAEVFKAAAAERPAL